MLDLDTGALLRTGSASHPAGTSLPPDAASALVEEVGADDLARRTGCVPVASLTITKLRWLRDNEPHNTQRVVAVASVLSLIAGLSFVTARPGRAWQRA